jgi:hypothetical protein
MKVGKSVFAVSALTLCLLPAYSAGKASQSAAPAFPVISDGGDPMPLPYPKPKALQASAEAEVQPPLLDGGDPMPLPYPRRLA